MTEITISRFSSAKDNAPRHETIDIPAFVRLLTTPLPLPTTVDQFFGTAAEQGREEALGQDGEKERKAKQRAIKENTLPAWSPASFRPGTKRHKNHVERLACIALDVDDDAEATVESVAECLRGLRWAGVVYTTIKDRGELDGSVRRLRVVVLVSRTFTSEEFEPLRNECARALNLTFDPSTETDTARIFFLPARLAGGTFDSASTVEEGEGVDVGALLARAGAAPSLARPDKAHAIRPDSAHAPSPDNVRGKGWHGGAGTVADKAESCGALPPHAHAKFREAVMFLTKVNEKGEPCARGGHVLNYLAWFLVGCGIANALGKNEEAFRLFDEASSRVWRQLDLPVATIRFAG